MGLSDDAFEINKELFLATDRQTRSLVLRKASIDAAMADLKFKIQEFYKFCVENEVAPCESATLEYESSSGYSKYFQKFGPSKWGSIVASRPAGWAFLPESTILGRAGFPDLLIDTNGVLNILNGYSEKIKKRRSREELRIAKEYFGRSHSYEIRKLRGRQEHFVGHYSYHPVELTCEAADRLEFSEISGSNKILYIANGDVDAFRHDGTNLRGKVFVADSLIVSDPEIRNWKQSKLLDESLATQLASFLRDDN